MSEYERYSEMKKQSPRITGVLGKVKKNLCPFVLCLETFIIFATA